MAFLPEITKREVTQMAYNANANRYNGMKYNYCGKSGLKLPQVSLGLWHNFGTNDDMTNMKLMCRTAFDLGITHFDLANNYGPMPGSAEENFGKILREDFSCYRDELLISTKAGYYMWPGPYGDFGSRKYLLSSLDASLKRMGIPYVDIFYHHRMDPNTPLEETMMALDQAVKSGKAIYAGLSNYDGEHLKQASAILRELKCPFVINQNRYNIFDRSIERNGLIAASKEEGKGIIAFSPLAQGMLSGRYIDGIPSDSRAAKGGFLKPTDITEEKLNKIRRLSNVAKERGQTLAQMALSWVLKDGAVTSVLIGASSPEQIRENAKIVTAAPFTEEELEMIDKIALN